MTLLIYEISLIMSIVC